LRKATISSEALLRTGAEKPNLNCLLEPEPKLRIPDPAPFYLRQTWSNIIFKIMVAEEFFRKFFYINFKLRFLIKLSGCGAGAEIRIRGSLGPELKEIFSAPQHCSGLWLCGSLFVNWTVAEKRLTQEVFFVKESDVLSVIFKAVLRDPGCSYRILFFPLRIQGDNILDPGSGFS
jgi:hypothetical protein